MKIIFIVAIATALAGCATHNPVCMPGQSIVEKHIPAHTTRTAGNPKENRDVYHPAKNVKECK